MIQFTSVLTPDLKNFVNGSKESLPLRDVENQLVTHLNEGRNEEFKKGKWSDGCTNILLENPLTLYLYDRYSYCLSKAYGHENYKVLINPMFVFCYHKSCCCAVRLKHMFDIKSYIKHCFIHSDSIGESMVKRLEAVDDDNFITFNDLDEVAPSPYSSQPDLYLGDQSIHDLEALGIIRDCQVYTTHWKEQFIRLNVIQSNSLSFQEDEALNYMLLKFPDPVQNWTVWSTLELYCTKLYCSISAAALNLFRGFTGTRMAKKNVAVDVQDYCKDINHPGPSLTTEQRRLPPLSYQSETFHGNEIGCHLLVMEKNKESIKLSFPNVVCYLATVVIDEQEINQGSFIHNNKLFGLKNPMSVEDLKTVTLSKLAEHITEVNAFISSVREYRIIDFNGFMCTNVSTSFEAGALNYEQCTVKLKRAKDSAKSCVSCLKEGISCVYNVINEQCINCQGNGNICVRFAVFHVVWDMGSSHVKTKLLADQIEDDTPESLFHSADLSTIGFGGLHLAKAHVNAMRNHILSDGNLNYGLNIFRCIKQRSTLLTNMKQAVYVAKDRQSDLLSYLTCSPQVVQALEELKFYQVRRIPEPILGYTKNAKTQKDLIYPTCITTNQNGDVLVLDKGASCVHVVDRCVVSRVFTIGKYSEPCLLPYGEPKEVTSSNVRFSNHVKDMVSNDDDIYILDADRHEIVIVPSLTVAKIVGSKKIYILNDVDGSSLAHDGDHLLVLSSCGKFVQFLKPLIPKKYQPIITYSVVRTITISFKIIHIFHFSTGVVGGVNKKNDVLSYDMSLDSWCSTNIRSKCKPSVNQAGYLCIMNDDGISFHDQSYSQVGEVLTIDDAIQFHTWGDIIYIIKKLTLFSYSLEEVGPLSFGSNFSSAINDFYKAISYSKPGKDILLEKISLRESIKLATPLVNLLKEIQSSLNAKYSTRSSFQGDFGTPWSQTVNCLVDTVASWSALVRRLDFFDPQLADRVYSHSITNESWIEHSFGFTSKKGQGHLQNLKEYVESKRKHAIDFQIRMTKTPFCQYTKTKVRDKGYQALIDVGKTKLSVKEILGIFKHKGNKEEEEVEEISEKDEIVLKQAFLLTKSVPRQSNRAKWRESSGFQPNLLDDFVGTRWLDKGDLVFSRDLEDELVYLLVQKKMKLDGSAESVEAVESTDINLVKKIPLHKLVLDGSSIAVVPSALFKVQDDGVLLFEAEVNEMVSILAHKQTIELYTDDDRALLMNVEEEVSTDQLNTLSDSRRKTNKRKNNGEDRVNKMPKIIEDSDLDAQCTSGSAIDEEEIKIGSCVQVVQDPFKGLYAKVTEKCGNELMINYFQEKKTYGGRYWVLKWKDTDTRPKNELRSVIAINDERERYTFEDI